MTKKKATPSDADTATEPKAAKTKTPAKKAAKKAAKTVAAPEAMPALAPAKPTKKAAKKAKVAEPELPVTEPEAEITPSEPEIPAAPKTTIKKFVAKKAAAKAPKADKGRDLVTDQPGAAEIAAILPEKAAEAGTDAAAPAFKGPEPKLERLQKILAKAGISSRRKAEELILGGQVQINGKVVMELGTKADPERDHIRVDGKLLQGPERIRYFVLNKPKGYVTTVSDPEGRPTVMQFFASERERLYPVGRLDYLSEGLLLVTNDGELANKLTKAASGVEKTYLVKVAGQPTEDMLDVLRGGVVIEKGRPGENTGRVRTAPARIRQVRQGDNPWYEVIIIEGRNRELRKMFEEIGHHVEKIRRVGYGPLILDLEPGKLRELEPEEVRALHLAAEGKLKKKNKKSAAAGQLPTVAGRAVRYKKADGKAAYEPIKRTPRPEFQVESPAEPRPEFKRIPKAEFHAGDKPAFKARPKPEFRTQGKSDFKGDYPARPKPSFKSGFKSEGKPAFRSDARPPFKSADRSEFKPAFKPVSKPGFQSAARPSFADRGNAPARSRRPERPDTAPPVTDYVLPVRKPRPGLDDDATPQKGAFNPDYKPGFRTGDAASRSGSKPAFRSDRPGGKPSFRKDADAPRGKFPPPMGRYNASDDDFVPSKTPGFRIEPVEDKPRPERPRSTGPAGRTGSFSRPASGSGAGPGKPFRPSGDRPFRPRTDAPPSEGKTFRPRPAGARPSGDRPYRPSARPAAGSEGRSNAARPARQDRSARPARPARFTPRPGGDGPPRKFPSARPPGPRPTSGPAAPSSSPGPRKTGPDGEPRIKERWRNSFTGKNKGRPKPKPKSEE